MHFVLGEITIPIRAGLEFSQSYELIGGTITQRMQSGLAIKQTHFNKLRTTLSGQGWIPSGLDGLDYSKPLLLKCAAPRVIASSINQFTIPSNRRNDPGFEAVGYVLVSGELIPADLLIQADLATIAINPGATCYQVQYYPQFFVFAEPVQTQGNLSNAEFSWTLTCEEV